MKFKTFELIGFRHNKTIMLYFNKKRDSLKSSDILFINKEKPRFNLTISKEIADRCRIKQEIKRANKKGSSPQGLHLLAELVEKDIQELRPGMSWEEWYRVFAYETIYQIAFSRGVKQERERRKRHDNIGALTGNDIADLSQALGIDVNKLNTAVLELTASRKAV